MRKKIVIIVGDIQCGKSCLRARLELGNDLAEDFFLYYYGYIREVIPKEVTVGGEKVTLEFWDVTSYEEYERLRPLAFHMAHIVLLCYSIDDPQSLENIQSKWLPEIKHHRPHIPCLLIGTKLDLRTDESSKRVVTYVKGLEISNICKTKRFIECSAKYNIGIQQIVEECAIILLKSRKTQVYKKRSCIIL